jgi:arginine decarboxylase
MTEDKINNAPYYNIGQFRVNCWNYLKTAAVELTRCVQYSEDEKRQIAEVHDLLISLENIEGYFAFPGKTRLKQLVNSFTLKEYTAFAHTIITITQELVSDSYRSNPDFLEDDTISLAEMEVNKKPKSIPNNYFEILFVENLNDDEELVIRQKLNELHDTNDQFSYGVVFQRNFQDALITLLFNTNIQAVVVRYAPPYKSDKITDLIKPYIQTILQLDLSDRSEVDLGPLLGKLAKRFRPELDTYYLTDTSLNQLEDKTLSSFNRIFYRKEDLLEIHLCILQGVRDRYETPFFTALKEYSKKPTGVFHAMPISRGNSVFRSRWINDFGEFYGRNMFLAETSATTGGLDSLLQPTGPLKKAQEMASDAYGSENTYFVTNGTSTANKIVMQALVQPGDVVLVDRDCHKSHHYGLVLSGAFPVYLDSYPIEKYSMYGAVPLELIKSKLLKLKEVGRLDKVKMLLLTNCTFDGIVYNVERVMEEVLAIKPDMVFLWDEAWFAFASFTYNYKQRTAMFNAKKLQLKYRTEKYRKEYVKHLKSLKEGELPTLPDPEEVRIRVYATQSTHKTLSSFRQGSMIHIYDEDFRRKSHSTFLEAYMTHTSTSPNYQMLASLDVGRRQVQFEGYEMVERSIELAMLFRAKVNDNPKLNKYFDVLTVHDFIPDKHRSSKMEEYYNTKNGWNRMEEAWIKDEFVLDPTKITLHIGRTGVDGDTFKNKYLMDKFNIQINKTSRNTVLFMTNIGTTRGSLTYLTSVLLQISKDLDEERKAFNKRELEIYEEKIHSLTQEVPPLPDFSYFHFSFQAVPGVPGGNLREAFFLSYDEDNYEYIPLENCLPEMENGKELVASSFVIPYPPGFPVLVPGQVVSKEIIEFLLALDVSEIHGFRVDLGLRVFTQNILDRQQTITSIGAMAKGMSKSN